MSDQPHRADSLLKGLRPASKGAGPLLQRDYWAVLRDCRVTCGEIGELVRRRFESFPPEKLVRFSRRSGKDRPLQVGDELDVSIRGAGDTWVRVVHMDDNSMTVATALDHPEAGRITFGSYRNSREDVIFHIRSLARSATRKHRTGFLLSGEPMQTSTWTDFLDRLAYTVADGVVGSIFVETREIPDDDWDTTVDAPTFIARGE